MDPKSYEMKFLLFDKKEEHVSTSEGGKRYTEDGDTKHHNEMDISWSVKIRRLYYPEYVACISDDRM